MANKLGHALRWRCRIGFFPGRVGRPYGKKTNERERFGRSAVSAAPKDSSDVAFLRASPSFALRRSRPLERRKNRYWRTDWARFRVGISTAATCSAGLTPRARKSRLAQIFRTKCHLGGVVSAGRPVVPFFHADTHQLWRHIGATLLFRHMHFCFRSAGIDLSGGEKTEGGEGFRQKAAKAAPPRRVIRSK